MDAWATQSGTTVSTTAESAQRSAFKPFLIHFEQKMSLLRSVNLCQWSCRSYVRAFVSFCCTVVLYDSLLSKHFAVMPAALRQKQNICILLQGATVVVNCVRLRYVHCSNLLPRQDLEKRKFTLKRTMQDLMIELSGDTPPIMKKENERSCKHDGTTSQHSVLLEL